MPTQATQELQRRSQAKLDAVRASIANPQPQPVRQAPAHPQAQPAPTAPAALEEPVLLAPPPVEPAPAAPPAVAVEATSGLDLSMHADELDPAKLQHRIRTIEGIRDQDTRRFQEREQRLLNEKQELETKLADATRKPVAQPKLEDIFSAEEIEELGADVLRKQMGAMSEFTAHAINERMAPLERELKQTKERQQEDAQTAQQKRESDFVVALSAGVPGWEKWASTGPNLHPKFKEWLDIRVYGKARKDLLNEASVNLDSEAVIAMLKDFLQSLSKGTPVPQPNSRQIPEGAAPGNDPPPPAAQYDFTQSQVKAFMSDVTHGKYKGQGRLVNETMNRIREAGAKGRIGPG